jgi:hypothetical protein
MLPCHRINHKPPPLPFVNRLGGVLARLANYLMLLQTFDSRAIFVPADLPMNRPGLCHNFID